MRNVSKQYLEKMKERRDFYATAEITFVSGQKITLGKSDFTMSGNFITESAESSSFPLGILAAKRITISLMNDDDRWSEYDFYGAKIFLRTNFDLDDGTTEMLNIGTFTVVTPENYGTTISITAMDNSYKTDKDYSTSLSYPMSAGEALRDSCRTCGITLQTSTFPNDDYVIPAVPEDITHRHLIGMIAMIAGGNAIMDEYNRLIIKPYDFSKFEKTNDTWGGVFDNLAEERYMTGDNVSGGVFEPWDVGEVDDPVFSDMDDIHFFYGFKFGVKVESDDVVITGVQITDDKKNVHLYGSEGYVLSLENQLAAGKEDEVMRRIGQAIVGLRFRPFSGDHIAYPLAEFMDLAYLADRTGRAYRTVLTDVNFTYYGFTSLKCAADSPIRNSSTYYGNETKAVVQARKATEKQLSAYDLAVQQMNTLAANTMGFFSSTEKAPDGSIIAYRHDKPTREESTIIYKSGIDGFFVSRDGGKSYDNGFDSQGNAVLNVLSVIGINFDWAYGGTLTLGGKDNKSGWMRVLNDVGDQIVKCGQDGIESIAGMIGGWNIGKNGLYNDDIGASIKRGSAGFFNHPSSVLVLYAGSKRYSEMVKNADEGIDEFPEFFVTSDGNANMKNLTAEGDIWGKTVTAGNGVTKTFDVLTGIEWTTQDGWVREITKFHFKKITVISGIITNIEDKDGYPT